MARRRPPSLSVSRFNLDRTATVCFPLTDFCRGGNFHEREKFSGKKVRGGDGEVDLGGPDG